MEILDYCSPVSLWAPVPCSSSTMSITSLFHSVPNPLSLLSSLLPQWHPSSWSLKSKSWRWPQPSWLWPYHLLRIWLPKSVLCFPLTPTPAWPKQSLDRGWEGTPPRKHPFITCLLLPASIIKNFTYSSRHGPMPPHSGRAYEFMSTWGPTKSLHYHQTSQGMFNKLGQNSLISSSKLKFIKLSNVYSDQAACNRHISGNPQTSREQAFIITKEVS